MIHKIYQYPAPSVVLHILLFVCYGFYEITLFLIICISLKKEKQQQKKYFIANQPYCHVKPLNQLLPLKLTA